MAKDVEAAEIDLALALASSPAVGRELARIEDECRNGALRLRDVLRDGAPRRREGQALLSLMASAESATSAELTAQLPSWRLHRRTLDRLAAAVARSDPSFHAVAAARRRADRAKAAFVHAYLPLVTSTARRYRRPGVELKDVEQEGTIGLMRAVDKFDFRRGVRFSVYARWWVRQQIHRGLVEHERIIRLPLGVVETEQRVRRGRRVFHNQHGRTPDARELATTSGLTADAITSSDSVVLQPVHLDAAVSGGEGMPLVDSLTDHAPWLDDHVAIARRTKTLHALVDALPPRDREVLRLRFGLEDGHERSLQEIGDRFAVTRERIRRIEARALRKLQYDAERAFGSFLAA